MGYIQKLTCQCGYKKELNLGTGRHIPDAAYINEHFSAGKLSEFNTALKYGKLGRLFYIENTLSFCKKCNDMKEGSMLHYQVGDTEKKIHDVCNVCNQELELIEDEPKCPRCGKILNTEMSGLWD